MTKTFWEKLEEKQGADSYFGPFHRLAMFRGRGGDYTSELRQAREMRREKPDAPGHWLEFYNVYLDTLAAHYRPGDSSQENVYSILQHGVTVIPVLNKHDELGLLSRIYHHCHESSGSRQTVDGVATRIFFLFSNSICDQYDWITANQCSFLVPVIAAHFLWAMKKNGIEMTALYRGLRTEQSYSHALKLYAQCFINHFVKSFGYWHNEESFFYALKLLASNQFEESAKIELFYESWHKSPNNVVVLKERPVSQNLRAVVDIIQSATEGEAVVTQERISALPLLLDEKTQEEHTKNHRAFWGKVEKSKAPFTLLSSCHYQPEESRPSRDQKAYFYANKARKVVADLPWSFFEVFDKLCDALACSIRATRPLFNEESVNIAFGSQRFSSKDISSNVLLGMYHVLSGDETDQATLRLRKALNEGFHSYSRNMSDRQYDDPMAFFATAQLLHQLSKAGIDATIVLSHLDDEKLFSSVSLYACQFIQTVFRVIYQNEYDVSSEWLTKVLIGKISYSQSMHEEWAKSDYNSVSDIKKRLDALTQEQEESSVEASIEELLEHTSEVQELEMTPLGPEAQLSANNSKESFEEIDLGSAADSREKYFSDYVAKIKAEKYWTPVRIAVSFCLPFMAIWFAIESCLNRRGIRLREEALSSEESIGLEPDSAFRKPRHLHHAIWTGLTACCRRQPVETRAIREWNQSQINS